VTLSNVLHRSAKIAADNSPLILTAIGVAGTITTGVLAAKGGIKATQYLSSRAPHTDNIDYIKRTWKFYIPAAVTGVGTITCIICANRIGTRRAAAMASAYVISQETMTEYRSKVIEKLGARKEQKLHDEIAQDRVNRNPPREDLAIIGDLEVRCMEMYTGRYFSSNMETLKAAQNSVNHQILSGNDSASLSDFYDRVGLNHTGVSDEVGWNLDNMMELTFSTTVDEKDRPVLVFDYKVVPVRNYFRYH
jgi:hypothetical protein